MNTGKCPKCDASINTVKIEPITSEPLAGESSHEGVSYVCPACGTVLGVNLTPTTLQEEATQS